MISKEPKSIDPILSAGDSHANQLAGREINLPRMILVGCGQNLGDWFARWNPITSSWKTPQVCLMGDLEMFSEIWPHSGLMLNGACYLRAPLALHTHETACSSLPTVTKSDGTGQAAILTDAMEFFSDQNGKPRRIAPSGSTWSAGLSRLMKMATGGNLQPRFAEWMMGFPIDWTELERSETPLSPKSPNGSVVGSSHPQTDKSSP